MSKTIVKVGLCALVLVALLPAFAGAADVPVVKEAAPAPAVAAPAVDVTAQAALERLFPALSSSCPSPSRKFDDVRIGDIIEGPVKEEGPINLAACGNCPGSCNSDPGCAGKVLGDPCDPTDATLVCTTAGAGCKAFNCCTCGY